MQWIFLLYALQTVVGMVAGVWVLYRWQHLFLWLRFPGLVRRFRIIAVTCCFYAAFQPANYGWYKMSQGISDYLKYGGYFYMSALALLTSLVFETVSKWKHYAQLPVSHQKMWGFFILSVTPLLSEIALSPFSGFKGIYLTDNLAFTLWAGTMAATIWLFFTNFASEQKMALQKKELELSKLNQKKTEVELEALQAKINPHFLYNALNAMAGLALEDGPKTASMAVALSRFFRYNLNRDQTPLAPLEEEAEMVKEYLTIEKIRFEDRLFFTMDVEEAAKPVKIPRNILQPLVENGIKHGFEQNQGICKLHLKAWAAPQDPFLTIALSDNGKAFPDNLRPGFGLQSLQDKLRLLFPQRHQVVFQNDPNKEIIIRFYHESLV